MQVHLHAGHVALCCAAQQALKSVNWVQGRLQVQQSVSKPALQPGGSVQHQASMHPPADQQLTSGAETDAAAAGAQEPAEGAEVAQAGQP